MLFKTVIVLYSFVVLASTKECKPGQNCDFKCCTIPEGDVLCRERCLGVSCELDVHCDGDCCVNSTCSSCLLKRPSSTKPVRLHNGNGCSSRNECLSSCCIDGQCAEHSRCLPVKAARGGRSRIRTGGSGGTSDSTFPTWAIGLIVGLSLLFSCVIPLICWCVRNCDSE